MTLDLTEGKNREIKRVMEHYGLQVSRLIRISFGPFQLGEIAEGAVEEIRLKYLKDQLGPRLAAEAGVDFEGPRFEHGGAAEEEPRKKRFEKRKPHEKRAAIWRGEETNYELRKESFATRSGKVVTVERIGDDGSRGGRGRSLRRQSRREQADAEAGPMSGACATVMMRSVPPRRVVRARAGTGPAASTATARRAVRMPAASALTAPAPRARRAIGLSVHARRAAKTKRGQATAPV